MQSSALHCAFMSDALNALPDDVETLKRLLLGRDELIAKLVAEIARLKRWRFGRSAERIDPELRQLQLALGELLVSSAGEAADQLAAPAEDSARIAPPHDTRRLRRAPRALPAHLPRETIVHAGQLHLSRLRRAAAPARRRHLRA